MIIVSWVKASLLLLQKACLRTLPVNQHDPPSAFFHFISSWTLTYYLTSPITLSDILSLHLQRLIMAHVTTETLCSWTELNVTYIHYLRISFLDGNISLYFPMSNVLLERTLYRTTTRILLTNHNDSSENMHCYFISSAGSLKRGVKTEHIHAHTTSKT